MKVYLIIGILFMLFADILHWEVLKGNPKYHIGWKERLFCVLLWPIGLYVFLKAFFSNYDRDN